MGLVGILTLIEARRGVSRGRLRLVWPLLTVAAGVLLPGFVLAMSEQRLTDAAIALWRDVQQRQHVFMAAALLAGGSLELWRRSTRETTGWWAWPMALVVLAALLATHTEYGTPEAVRWAVRQHVYQGLTVAAAGVCFAAARWHRRARRIAVLMGPLLLIVGAVLLLTYREPPGAYERGATYSR